MFIVIQDGTWNMNPRFFVFECIGEHYKYIGHERYDRCLVGKGKDSNNRWSFRYRWTREQTDLYHMFDSFATVQTNVLIKRKLVAPILFEGETKEEARNFIKMYLSI